MSQGMSEVEARVRRLEVAIGDLYRRLTSLLHKVGELGQDPGTGPGGGGTFGRLAITTSIITAGGSGTLGKGTAKLQDVVADPTTLAGTYSDGIDATIYHAGAVAIPSGTLVQLKPLPGNILLVDVRYCS